MHSNGVLSGGSLVGKNLSKYMSNRVYIDAQLYYDYSSYKMKLSPRSISSINPRDGVIKRQLTLSRESFTDPNGHEVFPKTIITYQYKYVDTIIENGRTYHMFAGGATDIQNHGAGDPFISSIHGLKIEEDIFNFYHGEQGLVSGDGMGGFYIRPDIHGDFDWALTDEYLDRVDYYITEDTKYLSKIPSLHNDNPTPTPSQPNVGPDGQPLPVADVDTTNTASPNINMPPPTTDYQYIFGQQDRGTEVKIVGTPGDANQFTQMPPNFPQITDVTSNDAKYVYEHSVPSAGLTGNISFEGKEFLFGGVPTSILPIMIAKESNTAIGSTNVIHGETSISNNVGEHVETIVFSFEFIGYEQINNELRRIISQFYRMPFIPVQVLAPAKKKSGGSYLLHRGIDAVAQEAIQISTVPGSPDAIAISVICKRFDFSQYMPGYVSYRDAISWPIWHYQVNRGLREYRDPMFHRADLKAYRPRRGIGMSISPIYGELSTDIDFWIPSIEQVEDVMINNATEEITPLFEIIRDHVCRDITPESWDAESEEASIKAIKDIILGKISSAKFDREELHDRTLMRPHQHEDVEGYFVFDDSKISPIAQNQLRQNQETVPFLQVEDVTYAFIPLTDNGITSIAKSYYLLQKGDTYSAMNVLTEVAYPIVGSIYDETLYEPVTAADLDFIQFKVSEDLTVDGVSVTITNVLAELPCSGSPIPMYQFMGRGPIRATISMTGSHESVSTLMDLKEEMDSLAYASRSHELEDSGILYIYNDILELAGLSNFMIIGASETTIEGEPDLSSATLNLVAVNPSQKDLETLVPLNPVQYQREDDGFGVAYSLTGNYGEGLALRLSQELRALYAMDQINLYPELDLPSIRELDAFLGTINYTNTVYTTSQHYDYISNREWVDPDFYTWPGLGLRNPGQSMMDDAEKIVASDTRTSGVDGVQKHNGSPDEIIPSGLKYVDETDKLSEELKAAIKVYDPTAPEVAPIEELAKALGVEGKAIAAAAGILMGRTDFMTSAELSKSAAETIDYIHHKIWTPGTEYAGQPVRERNSPEGIRKLWRLVSTLGPILPSDVSPDAYVGIIDNAIEAVNTNDRWVNPMAPNVEDIAGSNIPTEATSGIPEDDIIYLPQIDAPSIGDIQNRLKSCLFDEKAYSSRGRLLEAFPTMAFIINDEGERVNSWRFVDQYYLFRGVSSFAYTKHRMEATATAYVELSNLYENLTNWSAMQALSYADPMALQENISIGGKLLRNINLAWQELNDVVWRNMVRNIQESWTGNIDRFEPAIRWNWHRKIFATVLQSGFRVHVRMGYGNCFKRLATVMNGAIREVEYGDSTVRLVCQDDGKELTTMLPAVPGSTTTGWGSTAEPRDIIASILACRGGHWWFHRHDYRRLLDRYLTRNIVRDKFDQSWLSTWWANMNPLSIQSPFGIAHFGDPAISQGNYWLFGECGQNIFGYNTIGNAEPALGKGPWGYEWLTFGQSRFKEGGDEVNISIELYDMTTWDIAQVCASVNPDFIAQVHHFDMRSTLFYGKPTWPLAFTYDKVLYLRQLLITASVHEWLKSAEIQSQIQTAITDLANATQPNAPTMANVPNETTDMTLPIPAVPVPPPPTGQQTLAAADDKTIAKNITEFSHKLIKDAQASGIIPGIGQMSDTEIEQVKRMIQSSETANPYEPWSGIPVEVRKSFMQVHYAVSHVNLISSNLIATDEDVYTRCVSEYRGYNSLVKSALSIPGALVQAVGNVLSGNMGQTSPLNAETHVSIPVMADYRIVPEMQRTMTVDSRIYSTKIQGSFSRFQLSKLPSSPNWISTCVALSALRDSVKMMYKGSVTIRGNACIKPYDLIGIMDIQSGITGPVTARSVTHIMDASGFTTSIEPDCLVSSIVDPEMTASCNAWSTAICTVAWAHGFSKISSSLAGRALGSALANIIDIYVKIAGGDITGISLSLYDELNADTPRSTYKKVYEELSSGKIEERLQQLIEAAQTNKGKGFFGRTWMALKNFTLIKNAQVRRNLGGAVRNALGIATELSREDDVVKIAVAEAIADRLSNRQPIVAIQEEIQAIELEIISLQNEGASTALHPKMQALQFAQERQRMLSGRLRQLTKSASKKGAQRIGKVATGIAARSLGKIFSRTAIKSVIGFAGGPIGWITFGAGLVLEPSFGDWVKVQSNKLMFLQSLIITPLNRHGFEFSAGIKGHGGSVVTDPIPAWRRMLYGDNKTEAEQSIVNAIGWIDWIIPIGSLVREGEAGTGMLQSTGTTSSADDLFNLMESIQEKNMRKKLAASGNPKAIDEEEAQLEESAKMSLQEIIEQLEVQQALEMPFTGISDPQLRYAPSYTGNITADMIYKNANAVPVEQLPCKIEAAGSYAVISPIAQDGSRISNLWISVPTGFGRVEGNAIILGGLNGVEYRIQLFDQPKEGIGSAIANFVGNIETALGVGIGEPYQHYKIPVSGNGTVVEIFTKVKANAMDPGTYYRITDGKIVAEVLRRMVKR